MSMTRPLLVLLCVGLVVPASACAEPRSPEAFCDVLDTHKERYLTGMEAAQDNVEGGGGVGLLAGSAQAVAALGDLQVMWKDLAEVVPEEIRSDVETIRDTNQQQLDALTDSDGDALSAIASGAVAALATSGSYRRVDAYVRERCDP